MTSIEILGSILCTKGMNNTPFERIFLLNAFLGLIFSQLTEIQASNLISQKDIEAVVCGVPEKKGIISLHVDCDRNNQSSRIAF
jgi:hypothetical protein